MCNEKWRRIHVQQTAHSDGEISLNVLNTSTTSMWTSTRSHRDRLLLWFAKVYSLRQPGSDPLSRVMRADFFCIISFICDSCVLNFDSNSHCYPYPGTQLKSWQIAARSTASWPFGMAAYIPPWNSKNKSSSRLRWSVRSKGTHAHGRICWNDHTPALTSWYSIWYVQCPEIHARSCPENR